MEPDQTGSMEPAASAGNQLHRHAATGHALKAYLFLHVCALNTFTPDRASIPAAHRSFAVTAPSATLRYAQCDASTAGKHSLLAQAEASALPGNPAVTLLPSVRAWSQLWCEPTKSCAMQQCLKWTGRLTNLTVANSCE